MDVHALLLLLLIHISLLSLWSLICTSATLPAGVSLAKPNCQSHCGDIEIPYPFGIGSDCFYNDDGTGTFFQVLCDLNSRKPLLNLTDSQPELLEISLDGTMKVKSPVTFSDCDNKTNGRQTPNLTLSPFTFTKKNVFSAVSCGRVATLMDLNEGFTMALCLSMCDLGSGGRLYNDCGGVNCCQSTISAATAFGAWNASFGDLVFAADPDDLPACKYAFLVEQDWFSSASTNISAIVDMEYVPLVLRWSIYVDTYNYTKDNVTRNCVKDFGPCTCSKGYQGNPYLLDGCQDINECMDLNSPCVPGGICVNTNGSFICNYPNPKPVGSVKLVLIVLGSVFGLMFVIIGSWWLHKVMKKRKNIKRKQKFFRQNGGLLLKQQLSSGQVNVEKIKLFYATELEKATEWFNADRVIGEGGQGTVYKGMLTDGRIVAVKKSKLVDGGEVSQFINEIVILSQINNHRNVVKLLGCCLEYEVPLLVYEFLPNGTLSQYIRGNDEDFPLTWEMRLRIGTEVAGALSYLHSSASVPIYHRDIKSSNILLDEKRRAKIADFGISRSVPVEKTHRTMTQVNGTFGYFDPEYFRSKQYTDKSDVYSFGVVLAELLTGEKPISIIRSHDGTEEGRDLATYFTDSMKNTCLFDVLDAQVIKEGRKEEIMVVANLAKRCLNMKGKKRPTMREVASELEGVLLSIRSSHVEQNNAEAVYVQREIDEAWDTISSSRGSDMDTGSSLEVEPLCVSESASSYMRKGSTIKQ